jgi:hypothetical protein
MPASSSKFAKVQTTVSTVPYCILVSELRRADGDDE